MHWCCLEAVCVLTVCMETGVFVHELDGESLHVQPHLEDAYGHLTCTCMWACGMSKYLLNVFVTICGVVSPSPVCRGDWLLGTGMAESLQWVLWAQMCVMYVKASVARLGQPMGATSQAAAKDREKS